MQTNNYEKCNPCDGTGLTMIQTNEDECNQDICDECGGTGKILVPSICPVCNEQELRPIRIGNNSIPFEEWEETGDYECDGCGTTIGVDLAMGTEKNVEVTI